MHDLLPAPLRPRGDREQQESPRRDPERARAQGRPSAHLGQTQAHGAASARPGPAGPTAHGEVDAASLPPAPPRPLPRPLSPGRRGRGEELRRKVICAPGDCSKPGQARDSGGRGDRGQRDR